MRILYLHQFFITRAGGGGTRSYEFARRFVEAGHGVRMVTAGDGTRTEDGIEVVGVRGAYSDYMRATGFSNLRRMLAFARFALGATLAALRGPRPDVIYATSPPLTMALPALVAAARWRTPVVFEVRDLWPEAPIQMGALRSRLAQRLARALERFVYARSGRLIALSPGIHAALPQDKTELVPNSADLDLFDPSPPSGPFLVSYFGAMGEANDLTAAVEAARLLPEVRFVLMGDGKRRAALERSAPANVEFRRGAKEDVARLAAESAACLTLFKDVPVLATNSPNKLFDTFAAGRPAIVNMDGWMRELVEQNEAGLYVRAGDARGSRGEDRLAARPPRRRCADGSQRAGARRARVRPRRAGGPSARGARGRGALIQLSYCVVNTGGRDYLLDCLAAIKRTHPEGVEHELLVLDNASQDGSAEAVRELHPDVRLFALERREGKADNDSRLLAGRPRALLPASERGLRAARGRDARAARRARGRPRRGGRGRAAAHERGRADRLRLAAARTSRGRSAAAVFSHDRVAVQSTGDRVREVGWVQSSAMLVRRAAAEQVDWLDGDFFVYSDETDFCRRLHDAGWRILFVPGRTGGAPRPARHGLGGDEAAHRRIPPQSRPLLPKARDAAHPPRLEGLLDLGLSRSRRCRDGAAGPRPAPLPAAREAGAAARAG